MLHKEKWMLNQQNECRQRMKWMGKMGKKIETEQAPEYRTPQFTEVEKCILCPVRIYGAVRNSKWMKWNQNTNKMSQKIRRDGNEDGDRHFRNENGTHWISKFICESPRPKSTFDTIFSNGKWALLVFFGKRILFQLVSNSIEMERSIHIENSILPTSYLMAYGL